MNKLQFFIHNDSDALRIELSGSLSGANVDSVLHAWLKEISAYPQRLVVADVSYVTDADEHGRALLAMWHRSGACIIARSPQSWALVGQDLIGKRVAAVTETGGWATHVLVLAQVLVPVPPALDPALVETVLVNGITAWQMLYREAVVKPGQTILVHGANGGVGMVLSQLALHAGIRVIGTAAPRHHEALRSLGVEPVDYNAPDLPACVRALAPKGVDAAFDHLGLNSARISYSLLARRRVPDLLRQCGPPKRRQPQWQVDDLDLP